MVLIALFANPGLSSTFNQADQFLPTLDAGPEVATPKPKQRQVRLTKAEVGELLEARQAGATINELADQFGIHRTTVMEHLKRSGEPLHLLPNPSH